MRKKILMLGLAVALVVTFAFATPAKADAIADSVKNPVLRFFVRVIKVPLDVVVSPFELVGTIGKRVFTGKNGPIISTIAGGTNVVGRIGGGVLNIFTNGAYDVPYFEDCTLAKAIPSTPLLLNIADGMILGGVLGHHGYLQGWWGSGINNNPGFTGILIGGVTTLAIDGINQLEETPKFGYEGLGYNTNLALK